MRRPRLELGELLSETLPPVRDRRFWLTQGLVLTVFAAHLVMHFEFHGLAGVLIVTAYAFPVVYAALEFGLRGAVATTALVFMLTLPYVIDDAITGASVDLAGHLTDLGVLVVVAPVVGLVVERLRSERRAHEAAEIRYRALFVAGGVPALVLDANGQIQEANPAARALLREDLEGRGLDEIVGSDHAQALLVSDELVRLEVAKGLELRPVVSRVAGPSGEPLTQLLFQDVTEEAAGTRRTRAFALAVLSAQEDERRRIAQELHDEALQLVVELRRRVDRAMRHPAPDELSEATALADEVINELRTVALRLRPAELDDLGLPVALERLTSELARRDALIELVVDGTPRPLPPEVALVSYRVAQEALTNAEHHARARSIEVRLEFTRKGIQLAIADDGIGFDHSAVLEQPTPRHLGLLGMRERLEVVGGDLTISSSPGNGTTITAVIDC